MDGEHGVSGYDRRKLKNRERYNGLSGIIDVLE